ncbi:hypothetical protein EVAR_10165_1 [Eumeta japonica]|uniref:Uncharacterized protein n=1 Tax=Eumeta variegata TaxID=151549 RepID=A0A4C1TEB5_EUMVA|nr:hypothetical protein EVAR_10165_1 [Eumeta japonica]
MNKQLEARFRDPRAPTPPAPRAGARVPCVNKAFRARLGIETLKRCCSAGFHARWNSSTKNGTDLRLGVRALLIIARLTVDEKTVQRRWFPRTVELFDEERHRLETWRTDAAYHRSTDRG